MRKHNIESAVYDVAVQVRAVEDSIDSAIAEIGDLQSKMLRAHSVSMISVGTSQAAFEQMAEALTSLVAARGGMAGCHAALIDAKRAIPGMRATSFGDGTDCPPAAAVEPLRIVA